MLTRIFWFGVLLTQAAHAQTFTEKISKELSFEKPSADNALIIANLNGSVEVMGYDGDRIVVEVTRSIHAKTDARLEKGKAEVQLAVIDRADTLIVYVQDGCHQFTKNDRQSRHSSEPFPGWGYHAQYAKDCHPEYDYTMSFIVKVPASIHVIANTINNGNVAVKNVNGVVKAGNINGSISLANLKSQAEATTINGDLDIEYANNPGKACRFYSLNGDINASFQQGLSADIAFESFNGSFYTNILKIERLPQKMEKSSHGDGIHYKINGDRYQVGRGGALLDFETFNGNVYLKEKIN
ncbi:MAG: hypothetical protein WA874_20800 [Chryseosolibacter sp.]